MKAMMLQKPMPIEEKPLELVDVPVPEPGPGEVLVRVSMCGLCHTDLHTIEGDLELPEAPGVRISRNKEDPDVQVRALTVDDIATKTAQTIIRAGPEQVHRQQAMVAADIVQSTHRWLHVESTIRRLARAKRERPPFVRRMESGFARPATP